LDKVHPHAFLGWKDVLKLANHFRGVAAVKAGKGDMFCFWSDNWDINGSTQPFKERFPRLPSFVLDGNMSAAEVYSHEDIADILYLPLSRQAFQELGSLQVILQENPLTSQNDSWKYCWGEKYAAAKFYGHIHAHIQVPSVYQWI
jgi:hypothetical protein